MFFDFSKLLDWQYLSSPYPPTEFYLRNTLLIVAAASVLVAVLAWIIIGRFQKKYEIYEGLKFRIFYFFLFFGIIDAILVFLRTQGIAYFSSRLVYLLFVLAFFIWFLIIAFYLFLKFPKVKAKFEDRLRKEKYLPKKGNRR